MKTIDTDYNYEYDFLGSCNHKIHGSSNHDIPLDHKQSDTCPFCNKQIVLKIIKKRKVLKDQVFKKMCNKLFPNYIKCNDAVYFLVSGQIMGHRTCRIYYYNSKSNETLIESFIQEPDDCIKDFTDKLGKLVYKEIRQE